MIKSIKKVLKDLFRKDKQIEATHQTDLTLSERIKQYLVNNVTGVMITMYIVRQSNDELYKYALITENYHYYDLLVVINKDTDFDNLTVICMKYNFNHVIKLYNVNTDVTTDVCYEGELKGFLRNHKLILNLN